MVAGQKISPLKVAHTQLRTTARTIKLHPAILRFLTRPEKIIKVRIPVVMDTGSTKIFNGYRILHSTSRGAGKGGIRFDPGVNKDEVEALSTWMSLKTAVVGIPYGGGKGGVEVDSFKLSERELSLLSRGYIRELLNKDVNAIGAYRDVPAPDMGTNAKIMTWMTDEYLKWHIENQKRFVDDTLFIELNALYHEIKERSYDPCSSPLLEKYIELVKQDLSQGKVIKQSVEIGVLTGKPVHLGGSLGREKATGQGVFFTTEEILKSIGDEIGLGGNIKGKTVVVQGYGNVGSNTARIFYSAGAKILAVSDQWGAYTIRTGSISLSLTHI